MKNRSLPVKTRILFLFTLLCAAVASVQSIHATTITVMNTNDSGPGSLRQALSDANNGDTIDFDSSLKGQAITLTSGQLLVNRSVTISGPGADNLTVDGNANGRVFYINLGNTVTIDGLTIMNGSTSDFGGGISFGGGIYNDQATLTVSNCAISGNSGGGIYNDGTQGSPTLTVTNCTLSGNPGGGITNDGFGGSPTLTVTNCTLSGNSSGDGGGITNLTDSGSATVTVTNSTLTGNSASGGWGGGIYNYAANADGVAAVTVSNSTLSGNSASQQGGGIYNTHIFGSATVTVTNSTLSGNSASQGGGIANQGVRILFFDRAVSLTVTNSTLSGNSASQGGGIYNNAYYPDIATLTIGDTILSAGASGENIFNFGGTVTSLGYNLASDDGDGVLTGPGDQINTDPRLGPLQDNGGPTLTHALLRGSPAIDAGDPSFTPPPFYDQRGPGFPRVIRGRIDIGSFEVRRRHRLQP